ncbi:hypothetical protein IE81DRAFT_348981 [Ceraceosorus guamensis]|uniref:Serine aminopeptidase S33 domain-containing protein n=1 Tax=Ceraceosorus guamensis TaxID=1522189 RepID=A0A316VTZ4_9BASI|nr:hypothetical protein IE81DRAFT_348981 [Ceraceosorus guamensis]PWN40684.1 hypothetical protein IE81DRAFT_348981 [Ceraceosorus guamensis]
MITRTAHRLRTPDDIELSVTECKVNIHHTVAGDASFAAAAAPSIHSSDLAASDPDHEQERACSASMPAARLSSATRARARARKQGRIAIIAHPYAPLGGSQRDATVQRVAQVFLQSGITTYTYDARGAGASSGKTSWSGKAEILDFQTVADWALERQVLADRECTAAKAEEDGSKKVQVFAAGYSAGSLAASHYTAPQPHETFYLLVSYPLNVRWALSLFASTSHQEAVRKCVRGSGLLIQGDRDQFTRLSAYEKWLAELGKEAERRGVAEDERTDAPSDTGFNSLLVPGADHFWSSREARSRLSSAILDWIDGAIQR